MKLRRLNAADILQAFLGWSVLIVAAGMLLIFGTLLPYSLLVIPLTGLAWLIGRKLL